MIPPSISVICPTYNSAEFVAATIQSVLRQTLPPRELIISDDGSSDNTIEMVKRVAHHAPCDVQIFGNPHTGPGAARNAGIRAATGEWIAFLDSDDLWHPEKIARVSKAIIEHPKVNFFCHDEYHRFLDGTEKRLNLPARYQGMIVTRQLFMNCPFATSAIVCRRDLLTTYGVFDESLMSAQDFELWLRLAPYLRAHFIDEALGWYIDRPGNISSAKRWRHFRNVLVALSKNRRNTNVRWYLLGMARHGAVFFKNQLVALLARNL